eukprot:TRINITY_DN39568_c0_g1_i1.p1 TRINITY_DN39568_c0_g1~~TRINITY_DN39568_c0_g1_i1.p1  ORF type:complete len:576 (-),score=70.20 TRINITY_DN39568_c0_g1_i1:407-2134(-)
MPLSKFGWNVAAGGPVFPCKGCWLGMTPWPHEIEEQFHKRRMKGAWLALCAALASDVGRGAALFVAWPELEDELKPWVQGHYGTLAISMAMWLASLIYMGMPGSPEQSRERYYLVWGTGCLQCYFSGSVTTFPITLVNLLVSSLTQYLAVGQISLPALFLLFPMIIMCLFVPSDLQERELDVYGIRFHLAVSILLLLSIRMFVVNGASVPACKGMNTAKAEAELASPDADLTGYMVNSAAGNSREHNGTLVADSCGTSCVFDNFQLSEILDIGEDEHWLLRPEDVMIGKQLGSGGFGTVRYGLLHGITPVVIKEPKGWAERNEQSMCMSARTLANELRILRRIRHPDIVMFFGAVCSTLGGAFLCLVLEHIEGCTFEDFVKQPQTDGAFVSGCKNDLPAEKYVLLLDVARALQYLHAQQPKILHRDLKPSNILVETVRNPPHAKLSDFGLGFFLRGRCVSGRAGTKVYMAPEVADGQSYDTAADIFSFGCVMLFALTAAHPSTAPRSVAMQQGIKCSPNAKPYADMCVDCLRTDPSRRPNSLQIYERLSVYLRRAHDTEAAEHLALVGSSDKLTP